MKRLIDLLASAVALLLLSPLFLIVAVMIKIGSKGPVLFRHQRVGRSFKPLDVLKFRTMRQNAAGGEITVDGDARITSLGRVLRATKIDELPQLINVFRGEMSLVGPRPEVQRYVELFRKDYQQILSVRPGLTDLASLKYRNESALLAAAADPEREYVSVILPDKIRLAKEYISTASMLLDLKIIAWTVLKVFHVGGTPLQSRSE